MKKLSFLCALAALVMSSCTKNLTFVESNFDFVTKQLPYALNATDSVRTALAAEGKLGYGAKRRLTMWDLLDGRPRLVSRTSWVSGFFPGTLWYTYEYTKDAKWAQHAARFTEELDSLQYYTRTHDLGFMVYCSYGNGYRLTGNKGYKDVIVQSARSLSTRFNPTVACIRSWDHGSYTYPVIIDNMMNLELLTMATKFSGDSSFHKIAVTHARTTMKNHFRADGSSYHVVDYDPQTGKVIRKCTHQGYRDESSWSRGQSWGLYGFTMMYRETGHKEFLDMAVKIAEYLMNHPNMPEDKVAYWDYNAPNIPYEVKDVSAATVMASALYELSCYVGDKSAAYKKYADDIVKSVSTIYRADLGKSYGFLTLHSTGSFLSTRNPQIDVPLNYADYYFVEALIRKDRLEKTGKAL